MLKGNFVIAQLSWCCLMMELGKKKILGHYFIMKTDSILIVIPMYAQIPHL